ncbi:MAG: amidohydrolase family protein [Selenomonadaceae bacterium]|nr:amidohydrolase family protein [Selenomonadaceae bacterium]
MNSFVLKGNICCSDTPDKLRLFDNSYLVCLEGKCRGVFSTLPAEYQSLPLKDYGRNIIIPGLIDLHLHAPQFAFRGIGSDMELLDWLNTYTFPEERKYSDLSYAEKAYSIFTEELRRSATTRAVIFGTIHREATQLLMDKLEASGLVTMVGKVNMDRNAPDYLTETTESSVSETRRWLSESLGKYQRTKPIITPRFVPSCTDELMTALGEISVEYRLPVQSHLSENLSEVAWVKELVPSAETYGHAYEKFNLFGRDVPCVMAHCVHSPEAELALMKKNGVFIAHSPDSNTNLSSGIAPINRYIQMGMKVGLASDVAGGADINMLRMMAESIRASHLRWRLVDSEIPALTFANAFYLATKGGGEFFGKVGSFEPGYEFDALVIDDSTIATPRELSFPERLERLPYLADSRHIRAKYVFGQQLF